MNDLNLLQQTTTSSLQTKRLTNGTPTANIIPVPLSLLHSTPVTRGLTPTLAGLNPGSDRTAANNLGVATSAQVAQAQAVQAAQAQAAQVQAAQAQAAQAAQSQSAQVQAAQTQAAQAQAAQVQAAQAQAAQIQAAQVQALQTAASTTTTNNPNAYNTTSLVSQTSLGTISELSLQQLIRSTNTTPTNANLLASLSANDISNISGLSGGGTNANLINIFLENNSNS